MLEVVQRGIFRRGRLTNNPILLFKLTRKDAILTLDIAVDGLSAR